LEEKIMSKKRNQRNTKKSLKNLSAKRKAYRGGGSAAGEPALPETAATKRKKAGQRGKAAPKPKGPDYPTQEKNPEIPKNDGLFSDPNSGGGTKPKTGNEGDKVSTSDIDRNLNELRKINDAYTKETQTDNFKELSKRYNDSKGQDTTALEQIQAIQKQYQDQANKYQQTQFATTTTASPAIVPDFTIDGEPRRETYRTSQKEAGSRETPSDEKVQTGNDDAEGSGNTSNNSNDNDAGGMPEEAVDNGDTGDTSDTSDDEIGYPEQPKYDTAPVNPEMKRPDEVELEQMTAEKIKNLSPAMLSFYKRQLADPELSDNDRLLFNSALQTYGVTGDIQQLDDAKAITSTGVSAPTMAPAAQGTLTTATLPPKVVANTYEAVLAGELDPTEAAQMLDDPTIATADPAELTERARAATRDAAQEKAALQRSPDPFDKSPDSLVNQVSFRSTVDVSPTPEAEAADREKIIGTKARDRDAAEIINTLGFEAAQRRTVTGTAAKNTAAKMIAAVAEIPPEISEAIVEDPAIVTAQIDSEPVEVQAAVAALPTEALVSSQMESLLGGMEDGEVPMWARPAVQSVNNMLVRRGLSSSSVGRDALFNSIIQSAMPMAQSNAQALQARAAQNLSNEQQANITQSTQSMQMRLANLANRQTSESQTAQMAQQMKTMQSQFRQDAVMTTAQFQQQTRTQDLANRQEAAKMTAQNDQAMRAQNLGNEQQIELAEMQYMNATESENMSAEQQGRMMEFQTAADFLSKNAGFKQQMELANLNNDQQMRLANLSALNQAAADQMSADQQTELANLNTKMQTNLTSAKIAESMGVAQLNVDQQRAVTNASVNANIDLTKFSAEQQVALTNSKFMQSMTMADFNAEQQAAMQNATALATMDMANADQRTKLAITNAQSFLTRDMANLSNRQQAVILDQQMEQQRLLSDQAAKNSAKQFNAQSQNQADQFNANLAATMSQFNASQANAMEQFNTQETNRQAAIEAGNQLQADIATAQLDVEVQKFNEQSDLQRDQWNAANAQAIEQSNVQWRRQANTADTAAANAANQQNVQNAYNISALDQTQLWQQLRDEAAYVRQAYENNEQREAQLIATAIGNESGAGEDAGTTTLSLLNLIKQYKGDAAAISTGTSTNAGGSSGGNSNNNNNENTQDEK
jgi:hypothetical protein